MKLQFLGGAGTVTGSKTLVEIQSNGKDRSILVDCGLFQGLKALRLQNWNSLPLNPRTLDAVILTHAHLDHSGYLPLLVKNGFKGPIYCTTPTRDLVALVLRDAAHLQEEDASYANRKKFSKHDPARPLFSVQDAERAISMLEAIREEEDFSPCRGLEARLRPNGHILGSCVVRLQTDSESVTFSGDLGRQKPLLYGAPRALEETDFLVLESTYGDRDHAGTPETSSEELLSVVHETWKRGGHLIVPSFAIGRSQEMLHLLAGLKKKVQIPDVPIYLDTPMGRSATEIFAGNPGWHKLMPAQVSELMRVAKIVQSQEESIRIMRDESPKIIVAGSGMAAGGRVLHHLAHCLPDPRNTVLFTGFRAIGTRGRDLIEGAKEIKMHGRFIPVRAEIKMLANLSGHADQSETIAWLRTCPKPVKRVFIQHGEPSASLALSEKIQKELGWNTVIPVQGQIVDFLSDENESQPADSKGD